MEIPDGLHDTYFLRAMFFEDKKKLEKTAQEKHPTDDDTYLKRAQRGQISRAPGVLENTLNYSRESSSATKTYGKSDSASKLGYKGVDLTSILDYSNQRTGSQGNSPGINYGVKNSLYASKNYYPTLPKVKYESSFF